MLQKAELSCEADSENYLGGSSETMYYIGLDVHKKTISYCVKDAAGKIHQEGKIGSSRRELDGWIKTLPQPRMMAMEATIFTGWIYDHLLPHAEKVKVAHPLMLRAIAVAKRKNDTTDAQDRRPPSLRLAAGVLHGIDRDPGPAADAALPGSAGQANGIDGRTGYQGCCWRRACPIPNSGCTRRVTLRS